MGSPESAQVTPSRKVSALRAGSSLAWSAGLHAVLVAVAAGVPWSADDLPQPASTTVVWLDSLRLPEPEEPTTPSEPPIPTPVTPPEESVEPARPAPRQRRAERRTAPASESSTPPTSPSNPTRSPTDTPERPRVDWELERRRAIEQLRAQRERDGHYLTFSSSDAVTAPLPQDPNPWRDVLDPLFDAPRGGAPPKRNLLAVGEARTRFGRKLSELCNALTGGFGVSFQGFNLFTACAYADSGPDLDSPIRPETLKWLPECTRSPGDARPTIDDRGVADLDMKCRLRSSAELARDRQRAAEKPLRVDGP